MALLWVTRINLLRKLGEKENLKSQVISFYAPSLNEAFLDGLVSLCFLKEHEVTKYITKEYLGKQGHIHLRGEGAAGRPAL